MEHKSEAFTGLEAAIVLIAFVVVASVFSFAVLGAGFFTTEKTQEVLYSTVSSTGSTPELLGNVYGLKGTSGIDRIKFSVDLAPGGDIIDLSRMVMTWSTPETVKNLEPNSRLYVLSEGDVNKGCWAIVDIKPSSAADDTFLERNEVFTILIRLDSGEELTEGQKFTLEMKSPSSSIFMISRTAPFQIDSVNIL